MFGLSSLSTLLLLVAAGGDQSMHTQDFEDRNTHLELLLAQTDAQSTLLTHELSTQDPHGGKQAEHLVVRNVAGEICFVGYRFPKTPIIEELKATVWVKANRPGVRVHLQVVLPEDRDPATGKATVLLLDGELTATPNKWRLLSLSNAEVQLKKKQGLLQGRRNASVNIRNAYADMVVINVHTGPGESDVFVDDLQIGPIIAMERPKEKFEPGSMPANLEGKRMERPVVRAAADQQRARIVGDQLRVGERPFFLRGVRRSSNASAAPLERLKEAGFNSLLLSWPVETSVADDAERLGLHVIPMLGLIESGGRFRGPDVAELDVRDRDRWLAWDVGHGLDSDCNKLLRQTVEKLRGRDSQAVRPIMGVVTEDFRRLSSSLDLVGVQRYPLMSSLSLEAYQAWLAQRKNFARGQSVMIAGVQTHPPVEIARMTFGHSGESEFGAPIGPQPEQMRLLAYHTLAAGCRGLVFSTDWALSDLAHGRDRMLQAALLNEELMLLEPFVAEGRPPEELKTSNPNVAAYAFSHERGMMVLAFWRAPTSQFVVGQAALRDVEVVVRGAPDAAQAHQVGLGNVVDVRRRNGVGGTHITLNEVDVGGMVVLTTEAALIAEYQRRVKATSARCGPLQLELAEISLSKSKDEVARLQTTSRPNQELYEARNRLERASGHIAESQQALKAGDATRSMRESSYALRVVRNVQETLWKKAVANLASPVADPFATSFYTLTEHYRMEAAIAQAAFRDNLLPGGDFERDGRLDELGWGYYPFTTTGATADASIASDGRAASTAKQGRRWLELTVGIPPAKDGNRDIVLEHTRVAMISPPIPVKAGQLVRISGYIRMPVGVWGSVDGAMVWDNLGGEALALRFPKAPKWTPFVLYRPVRQTTSLRLNLVMTGIGQAQFDDVQISVADVATLPLAGRQERTGAGIRR